MRHTPRRYHGRFQRRIATAFLAGAEFVDAATIGCSRYALIAIARTGVLAVVRRGRSGPGPRPYVPTDATAEWIEHVMAAWRTPGRTRTTHPRT